MLRFNLLVFAVLMGGCATHIDGKFKKLPVLKDQQTIVWNYVCQKSGLLVEYANFSGRYTATINLPKTEQSQESGLPTSSRRVLDRVAQRDYFQLDDLIWTNESDGLFSYSEDGKVKYQGCVARNELRSSDIRLNLNFGLDKDN